MIYTKQIKYTVNSDTSVFNGVFRNPGFKKTRLGFLCTILFKRPYLKSFWVFFLSLACGGCDFRAFFFTVYIFFFSFLVPALSLGNPFEIGKHWLSKWLKLLRRGEDCTVKFLLWKKPLNYCVCMWGLGIGDEPCSSLYRFEHVGWDIPFILSSCPSSVLQAVESLNKFSNNGEWKNRLTNVQ